MKSHQNEILEKMKDNVYGELSFDFAFNLTNESDRGAILIGASKIENYLENLLLAIIPSHTKAYKSRLFNYPGTLSSFSGKIELLYAFRLIDELLYQSLNALRKIRNEAAHTSNAFSLKESKDLLATIYAFEPNFPDVIAHLAYDNLIKWKLRKVKKNFEDANLKEYDYQKLWDEQYPNPKDNEVIAEQLIIWELAHGLTFLSLKIEVITEEYKLMHSTGTTWSDLLVKPL